jgi:hypothetical protein
MFKVLIRSLETEAYEELCVRYQTREEAEEAVKHMWVQVRRGGEYIQPEEFVIQEDSVAGKSNV